MRVKVNGRYWNLRFIDMDALGDCDPPEAKQKRIHIATDLDPKTELETTIHELMHAAAWPASEEYIETVSNDIANVLWRLGYRKANNGS